MPSPEMAPQESQKECKCNRKRRMVHFAVIDVRKVHGSMHSPYVDIMAIQH